MGISEAERRVKELTALITNQLRLIRKLEKRGKDLTSAKIVFDSLRVSLFLATQDWHRVRCYGGPDRIRNDVSDTSSALKFKPRLNAVPNRNIQSYGARSIGGAPSMKAGDDFVDLVDKIGTKDSNEQLDASIVPGSDIEQKKSSSVEDFEFRPLTEEEKNEFVNSLNADGKRIVTQLAGKGTRSDESAA